MSGADGLRLYVVTSTHDGDERLLRASSKARAVRMSATARIASQADLERLLGAGVVPESQVPRPAAPRRPKLQRRA